MVARLGRAALCLSIALLLVPSVLSAQERASGAAFVDDWSKGRVRTFLALSGSAGAVSRADLTLGYGKPYWTYVGVSTEAASSAELASLATRVRLAFVYLDLSLGYARIWSYRHTELPREDTARDLKRGELADARYHAFSLVLAGLFPGPGGFFEWQLEGQHTLGVSADRLLYEEQLRVVMRPPWLLLGRLGYGYRFARERAYAGALAEAIWPGGRDAVIVRAGPMFGWSFSPRWDLAMGVTKEVHGPDALSFYEELGGNVRVRYRTASR